ncbi:toxin-antitoxin system HicB family antitoxin [Desulfobulbus sp. F4]|nr:toxin-antitoxin system HicB family antitoxin [Desulfobulbus sp. F4]
MSVLSLRLPDSLHRSARELADKEKISINQLVTLALAEKISALMTDDYIRARAARASQEKFERAMAKVADRESLEEDNL